MGCCVGIICVASPPRIHVCNYPAEIWVSRRDKIASRLEESLNKLADKIQK